MSTKPDTTGIGFIPASPGAVSPTRRLAEHIRTGGDPVRLRFQPWGRRRVGDPDDVPGYQVLDGRASVMDLWGERCLYVEDLSGRAFVVAPGGEFTPSNADDLPEWAVDGLSLSDCGPVLSAPGGGGGLVAVGTRVEILVPEDNAG